MVGIIDYEAGNLYNVAHAMDWLGVAWTFSSDPEVLKSADRIILPGVGAAGAAMASLESRGLVSFLRETRLPLLGICLGMQLLFSKSAEDGVHCLDRLAGEVKRIPANGLKVPHVGWNQVRWTDGCALAGSAAAGEFYYFLHSFVVRPADAAVVCAETEYGDRFASAVGSRNIWGVQFHPERSGSAGLRLLNNFVNWSPGSPR